ncbi:hypothetical protein [Kibdelosporangium philippinense]|uniref:hypothetical protein n=1 Tax=Kibdelosporangium philippinense TaxID=211113 RepID=UPI00360A4DF7
MATGDAGNPALAADPKSLAGKLLRIDTTGKPRRATQTEHRGDRQAVSTHRAASASARTRGRGDRPWAATRCDLPRGAGQAARQRGVDVAGQTRRRRMRRHSAVLMVAASTAGNMQNLPLNPEGVITAKPTVSLQDKEGFGRLGGMAVLNRNYALAGTVNKSGGTPVSSDDRVVLISTTAATRAQAERTSQAAQGLLPGPQPASPPRSRPTPAA